VLGTVRHGSLCLLASWLGGLSIQV
jgi:hypothetical protein